MRIKKSYPMKTQRERKYARKYKFIFEDGRVWENIPECDLRGWVHALNSRHKVYDSNGRLVGSTY